MSYSSMRTNTFWWWRGTIFMLETLELKLSIIICYFLFLFLSIDPGAPTDLGCGAFCSGHGWSFQTDLAPENKKRFGQSEIKRNEMISIELAWCTNPSLVFFSLLSASGEVQTLCEAFSPSELNSSIRGKSVPIATTTETCQWDTLMPARKQTHRPLLFVRLWRMVACTRALPDQVCWRLLRSSINHAPDMERKHLWSVSFSLRTLHIVQKWSKPTHGWWRLMVTCLSWTLIKCLLSWRIWFACTTGTFMELAVTSDLTRPSSSRRKSRSRCRTCRILDCSSSVRWLKSRRESAGSPSIPHWSTNPRCFSRQSCSHQHLKQHFKWEQVPFSCYEM